MSEKKTTQPGRYMADTQERPAKTQAAAAVAEAKNQAKPAAASTGKTSQGRAVAATYHLVGRLTGCLIGAACTAQAYYTGDITTRLTLILIAAILARGAFDVGVWSQRLRKGGDRNG